MGGTMKVGKRSSRARAALAAIAVVTLAGSAGFAVPAGAAEATALEEESEGECPDASGTVKIGMSYFGSVSTNLGQIGADTDLVPADQAVVDGYKRAIGALNEAGGIAGCQVEPVFFNFSAQAADFNQESQKECSAFTQDEKVFAVYAAAYETKVAVDCFAKAKTPFFSSGANYPPSCADAQQYAGYIYSPTGIYTCRFGSFIKLWNDAGLFPKDAKVGILVKDDGSGQGDFLADKVWIPELKKLKIPVSTFNYTGATAGSRRGEVTAALGNAILQFKAEGVNVILFTPAGAQAPAFFMPQANTQGYFPNYGITTADGFGISATLGGDAMKVGVGISWSLTDLPLQDQQALAANTAAEDCASWSTPSTTSTTGASGLCDFIHILHESMEGATKVDAATLKQGIAALGTKFASSVTYDGATKFTKKRFDGGIKAMLLEFDPTAKVWNPISDKTVTIP
ncbi:MAG TPA: ABC transporter substrate-binding protein [Acidimicrobiia bacterium]|nr:ABC transporter substrate-binding protein [Acidimicrobiia bacterium]